MQDSQSLWKEGNRVKRGVDKTNRVIVWLAEFHFSTRKIISAYLGVNPDGQSAFFSSLQKKGLVRSVSLPITNDKLLMLTQQGVDYASLHTPSVDKYSTEPSKIAPTTVFHNLSTQLAVIHRLNQFEPDAKVTSDRNLRSMNVSRVPDALIETPSMKLALEVELTQKKIDRIYRGFLEHVFAMKDGHYDSVEYVFNNEALCKNYRSKFFQKEWPHFIYDKSKKTYVPNGKRSSEKVHQLNRFTFTFEPLYM